MKKNINRLVGLLVGLFLVGSIFLMASTRRSPAVPAMPKSKSDDVQAPDSPDEAAEFYRMKRAPDGKGPIPINRYLAARDHTKRMLRYSTHLDQVFASENSTSLSPETIDLASWNSLGPGNIGGRTRSIVIDPTNPNVMYAGGVAGGVWKTTNAGSSWTALNDFMANLAVTTLAMDPNNSNVICAGTGEGFSNVDSVRGLGVFRTSNGGTTWTQLTSTNNSSWYYVNRLALSPNGQVILAATNTGIWRSTDGGGSWSNSFGTRMLDIRFNPSDANQCVSSGNGIAYYSTNGGSSWSAATGLPASGRIETAYSRSNPSIVYAAAEYSNGQAYRSTDGGHSFALRNSGLSFFNAGAGNQGWYDNAIWVDPTNANIVVIGGIDLWRSTNGASSFTRISQWQSAPQSAHADQHAIVASPQFNGTTNKTVFFGNDGGIYRATDIYTVSLTTGWTALNNSIGITQFYDGVPYPNGTRYFGGTQDNGTIRGSDGSPNSWARIYGGDGGYVAINPSNTDVLYGEYVYLSIKKSTNGGSSFTDVINGISESHNNFLFINPFIMDPSNSQRLWTGGHVMWRTTNGASSWSQASTTLSGNGSVSAIAVAPSNANYVLSGKASGSINRTSIGLTSNSSTVWSSSSPRSGYVSWLAFNPANANIAYATYSSFNSSPSDRHVYRSTDTGATWIGIDGSGSNSIPDIPVHALVVDPINTSRLYVGTDLGVFTSTDGGANWMQEITGFANVVTESLKAGAVNGVTNLFAFTHGRGAWRTSTAGPTPTPTPCAFYYEAESNSNTRTGGAIVQTCPTCSGSAKVGYIGDNSGTLQFNGVTGNASGTHVVTIYYTNGDPMRTAYLSVNGGSGIALNFPSTGSFNTVGSIQTSIILDGGSNTIRFYNPVNGSWAPDLDRIRVNCIPPPPTARAMVADFNGDGHPDWVVHNAATHETAIWYLNDNVLVSGAFGPTLPIPWRLACVADFNRDTHPDYAVIDPNSRQTLIGYLSGPTVVGVAFGPILPSGYELATAADFNNNGHPDYALYGASTRETAIWYLNNNVFVSGAAGPTLPAGWSLIGASDFNADGHADYALFNATTGQTLIGYLSGPTVIGAAFGPTVPGGWLLVAMADFNGDNHTDYLLYKSSTRQTAIWYLNNNVRIGTANGPVLPLGWTLAAP